ncbi:hypothetical protein CLOM_g8158 [Closterium sp. NIES-68]|nr:hypothetical protein CLOM_g8158 [Closterium sp. NIES-68]GJP68229.1 hypothetical protein CLOP_g24958 [Closterium sp. NIES-67]
MTKLPTVSADRAAVKEGRQTMARWWQWHGSDYPELSALACRVLSQPVSAAACERNWAAWEAIHTAKRNRPSAEKCRDLVFVSHNWNQVHNWHKEDGGSLVLPGTSSEALGLGVLVVDDTGVNLVVARRTLSRCGAAVATAGSGEDAVRRWL